MNLKLCRNGHNSSLYTKYVFIAVAHVLRSLGQLIVSIDLFGKSESRSLLLITDILTKVLQNYFLSDPLSNITFFSKPFNLIGCQGNPKAKFPKNTKENQLPRSYMGDNAEIL